MGHGHIFALRDAPILDWRGLEVIAFWDQELRTPQFETGYSWHSRMPAPPKLDTATEQARTLAAANRVELAFARGAVQVWQMRTEVKPEDVERVFTAPFRPADSGNPDDPRRVFSACRTLLNARRTHLSGDTLDELTFLSQRCQHQIEAVKW